MECPTKLFMWWMGEGRLERTFENYIEKGKLVTFGAIKHTIENSYPELYEFSLQGFPT